MKRNKIVLDFDGIFASNMLYTQHGKFAKTFSWGIRHSIELLVDGGFDVYIISGDSTDFGQAITKNFTNNLKIKEIIFCKSQDKLKVLKKKFDLSEIIYSGDDIFDIEIFKLVYAVAHKNVHEVIQYHADYISNYDPNDYYFMDMALHILSKFKYDGVNTVLLSEYLTKHTTHEPLHEYLKSKSLKKILIIQQYSMRSHDTNKYDIMLDGNLNLTLHRIAENSLDVTITIPNQATDESVTMLKDFCDKLFNDRVNFLNIDYGSNALENRNVLKKIKLENLDAYDVIISDFSDVSQLKNRSNVIYNYNISKIEELDRNYIDPYFQEQVETSLHCKDNLTYVLNDNQLDYMIKQANTEFDKLRLASSVIVDGPVMSKLLLKFQNLFFINQMTRLDKDDIADFINDTCKNSEMVLFFPFRLTDACYNFGEMLEELSLTRKDITILVTDPNQSFDPTYKETSVKVINLSDSFSPINKKSLYFYILSLIKSKKNVFVPVFENPEQVLHQSILEIHYLTNKVVFLNKDNWNYNKIVYNNSSKGIGYVESQLR